MRTDVAWVCEAFSSGCECAWGRDRWAAMGVGRRGITIGRLDDEDLELVVFLFVNVFFFIARLWRRVFGDSDRAVAAGLVAFRGRGMNEVGV